MIGYALCGSFCTIAQSLEQLKKLVDKKYDILPIVSFNVYDLDTRFWKAEELKKELKEICGRDIIHTIEEAEPLGPKLVLDALIISPCTGNTLSKLANGITDTPVTMAAKAHLRADRPLLIALSSNDAMSANLKNIAVMLEKKCVYFVPMKQDDPINKPHSLSAEFSEIPTALDAALAGKQLRKLFI